MLIFFPCCSIPSFFQCSFHRNLTGFFMLCSLPPWLVGDSAEIQTSCSGLLVHLSKEVFLKSSVHLLRQLFDLMSRWARVGPGTALHRSHVLSTTPPIITCRASSLAPKDDVIRFGDDGDSPSPPNIQPDNPGDAAAGPSAHHHHYPINIPPPPRIPPGRPEGWWAVRMRQVDIDILAGEEDESRLELLQDFIESKVIIHASRCRRPDPDAGNLCALKRSHL